MGQRIQESGEKKKLEADLQATLTLVYSWHHRFFSVLQFMLYTVGRYSLICISQTIRSLEFIESWEYAQRLHVSSSKTTCFIYSNCMRAYEDWLLNNSGFRNPEGFMHCDGEEVDSCENCAGLRTGRHVKYNKAREHQRSFRTTIQRTRRTFW